MLTQCVLVPGAAQDGIAAMPLLHDPSSLRDTVVAPLERHVAGASHKYGPVHLSDQAQAILGNLYNFNSGFLSPQIEAR